MAYVMKMPAAQKFVLPGGEATIDRILNVRSPVGPHDGCANLPSDVAAVQALIEIAAQAYSRRFHIPLPKPTGTFDAVTGFYIFEAQWRTKQSRNPGAVIDGCVSPASAAAFVPGSVWTIVHLNFAAWNVNRTAWAALLHKHGTTPA